VAQAGPATEASSQLDSLHRRVHPHENISPLLVGQPTCSSSLRTVAKSERRKRMMAFRERVLIIALSLVILIALGSYAQAKYVEKANEELYGTWTNESYAGISPGNYYSPQKVVITPGMYSDYSSLTDPSPAASGEEEVAIKWKDSEGSIWYKIQGSASEGKYTFKFQCLQKLSKSATVRELVSVLVDEYDPDGYPTKIDSQDSSYRIYYRAK
jgi:hypothetical protein